MVLSLGMYLVAGVVLVTLGVGSILARRWARDLSLLAAWAWLVVGVTTTAAMIFFVPRLMPVPPPDQAQTMTAVLTCMIFVCAILGVVVPIALILFYRSPNVRATCIALDPHPRWTERVPLPLLGLSLWNVLTGLSMIGMSFYAILPLGARIVTGPIAVVVYCALGVVFLYVGWGLYQRSVVAWWAGIAYGVLVAIWVVVVFPRLDYAKLIAAMKLPKTPGMPDLANIYRNPWFVSYAVVLWLLYFGYFGFVYRYIRTRTELPAS
jgi:hypothetical protein